MIMKKVTFWSMLMLAVLILPMMVACGGDGDDDGGISISPSSVSMHYDDTQQLNAQGATSWTSNDDFIAKVDQTGLVTGGHVGTTQITASNGKKSAICEVTITPEYNLYDSPILEWGASMNSVQSSEIHELLRSSDAALIYDYTKGTSPCLLTYSFENSTLKAIVAILNYSSYVDAGYYLLERYQPIGESEGMYIFLDALTQSKATTIVGLSTTTVSGSKVTEIIYMPASSNLRSVSNTSPFSLLFKDIEKESELLDIFK